MLLISSSAGEDRTEGKDQWRNKKQKRSGFKEARDVECSWLVFDNQIIDSGSRTESQAESQLSQEKLLMAFIFTTAAPFSFLRMQTNSKQFRLWATFATWKHLDLKREMRKTDTDLCLGLPVKSTFPYKSWICGARPSLKRYRLWMTTGTADKITRQNAHE